MYLRETHREKGMASLMVTTIMILVISLIVLGFSQVTRRNQRAVLDRQLSSQALYATESGINAATAVIRKNFAQQLPIPSKSQCAPSTDYPEQKLLDDDVKVTCLLVEPKVSEMVYDGVTENVATVIPITPVSGDIKRVTITWRPANGASDANAGCPSIGTPTYTLPVRSGWACGHGILRLDMTPLPTGSVTQAKTIFLYPHAQSTDVTADSTTVNANGPATEVLLPARCSAGSDPKCMVSIDFTAPVSQYYINARSLYKTSKLVVDGSNSAGVSQSFTGQVMVDVTAKAIDVLKRVQVRVAPQGKPNSSAPAYGIETSESLCKRFAVAPSYYRADQQANCPLN